MFMLIKCEHELQVLAVYTYTASATVCIVKWTHTGHIVFGRCGMRHAELGVTHNNNEVHFAMSERKCSINYTVPQTKISGYSRSCIYFYLAYLEHYPITRFSPIRPHLILYFLKTFYSSPLSPKQKMLEKSLKKKKCRIGAYRSKTGDGIVL